MASALVSGAPSAERWIYLGPDTARVPERLLLAHARGELLFITGAGTSLTAGLPDFKNLVIETYARLDAAVHGFIRLKPDDRPPLTGLLHKQVAEITRFDLGDYDVVLGMLERRIDGSTKLKGKVRTTIAEVLTLRPTPKGFAPPKPSAVHRALIRLANRGLACTIATTNFDRLLERATAPRVPSHTLGGIPRPSSHDDFAGVLHIHGALAANNNHSSEYVVTDRDFGEFYFRRRTVPDFIYDAARLFNIVLVGYSASDAPMRYLLNAVAADGLRFRDLRERFAFVPADGVPDPVTLEDWQGRGITPIPYDAANNHEQLGRTLKRWAELSPINGSRSKIRAQLKRLVINPRSETEERDRDLLDHLYRRGSAAERLEMARFISSAGAAFDWLDALIKINREAVGEGGA